MNVYINRINKLTDINRFWQDVRDIVGYWDETIFWEDWEIKELQRYADARYAKILEENNL